MDRLSTVLGQFAISAGVFYSGNLCGLASFDPDQEEAGHLHLLQSGTLRVVDYRGKATTLTEPTVLFFPRPAQHRLMAEEEDRAQLVCAAVKYGTGSRNPLANALPPLLRVALADAKTLHQVTELLFREAFAQELGREAMMNRLAEAFIIQLLRYVMDQGLVASGLLAGLTHPQLSKALQAMHESPAQNWTLEDLAQRAAMSRSKFAALFRERVGQPPGDYLVEWRIAVAQNLLKKSKPVGWVANEVGYENASALARAFRKKTGHSPRQWLSLQSEPGRS